MSAIDRQVGEPSAAAPSASSPAPSAPARPAAPRAGRLAGTEQLRALEQTLHILLAPLEYPDWQTWQADVLGRLMALTGADALCVYTPLASGPSAWYSPHVSDAELARYAVRVAADPTWDVIEHGYAALGRDVAHEDELLPRAALETSAFYHEFLRPNRIFDIVTAGTSFGGAAPARLHFSNHRRRSA